MCLAVPFKVIQIDGNDAVGESLGIRRDIRIDFVKDINLGDYVIVHAGFAIEKIEKEAALKNLRLIKEVTDALG
ncbi:MAG: HypC/HybG/HupF family hydrogenase formation chaperone [Caloramator sp.]|nr:HypC/HybG/HupF family hydrogenase formation chaperone [Caloramator sp.]